MTPTSSLMPASGIEPLLTEKEAAAILGITAATLQRDRWAAKREGTAPRYPYVKINVRTIRYLHDDIRRHIKENRVY